MRRACKLSGQKLDRLQAWSSIGYPEDFRAGREMLVVEGERGESHFPVESR
jgi:hypothetical protein